MTKLDPESSTLRIKVHFFHFFLKSFLWNNQIPPLFQQFCLVFSNFHCITILLWSQLYYIALGEHDGFSLAVKEISRFFLMNNYFSHTITDTAVVTIVLALTICYFLILLLCCCVIVKRFLNQENCSKIENKIIVILGQFHISVGFWFLHMILMNYISSGLLSIEVYELDAYQWIVSIIYFIFIVLNYLFGFLFAIFSYDPFKTSNILASHTPSFQIATFCLKAALAPIITTQENSGSQSWPLVIISLIILAVREYYLLSRFPFYDYSAMKTAAVLSKVALLVSIVSLVAIIIKSFETVDAMVLAYSVLIIIPFLIKFSNSYLDSTIRNYLVIPSRSLKSKNQVMKKLFSISCTMRKSNFNMNNKLNKNRDELQFLGALSWYNKLIESDGAALSQFEGIIISNTKETNAVLSQISSYYTSIGQTIIKKTLREGVEMFKQEDQLKVLFGYLALKNSFPMVVVSLCIMDTEHSSGHTKLTSLLLSQNLQESIDSFFYQNTGRLLNLKSFMEKEWATNWLLEEIKNVSKLYVGFWVKYSAPHLKIKEFYDKSIEIETKAGKIAKVWETYANKNKMFSQSFCHIYSLYLSVIRASPHQSDKVLQKFMIPEGDGDKEDKATKALIDDHLTDANVIALYASMTRESPGKIYKTSANITDLLGWRKDDVIGENVERMLPSFQRAPHYQVLLDHVASVFEGGKDSRMYRTIQGFILHKTGHIVPCDVYISVHPYVQEKPMYVVIVRVNKAHKDYIMVTRAGVIEAFSRRFGDRMGLSFTKKVSLSSLCQNYEEVDEALENCHGDPDPLNNFTVNIYENAQKNVNRMRSYVAQVFPRKMGRMPFFLLSLEPSGLKEEDLTKHNNLHQHQHQHQLSHHETENSELTVSDAFVKDVGILPMFSTSFHKTLVRTQKFSTPTLLIHDSEGTLVSKGSNTHHDHTPLHSRHHEKKRTFSDLPHALPLIGEKYEGENSQVVQVRTSDPHAMNSTGAMEHNNLASPLASPNGWHEILSPVHSSKQLVIEKSESSDVHKGGIKKQNVKQMQVEIMEASSVDTSSKNYTAKLELAVNVIPKNSQVKKLQLTLIFYIFLSAIPLIVFQFQNQSTLDLVGSGIEVMSKSVFRLVRITDLGQYVRNVWQAKIGLYHQDRYSYLGWNLDASDQFLNEIPTILKDLNMKNNDLREYIYRLDPDLTAEIYSTQLPVYEVNSNDTVTTTRTANTFDLITELVVQGNQFLTSGLPIDGDNPHLLFCLNNSFNDVLVAGERTIPLLLEDNRSKLSNQSIYVYGVMAFLATAGFLVMGLFVYIQKQFVKNRRHFISIFTLLDESTLQKHMQQAQKFITLLEKSNAENNKRVFHRAATENFQGLPSAKGKEIKRAKKSTDVRGLDTVLIGLYLLSALFLLLLFSAYPALLIYIASSTDSVITKMQLMSQSNLNLFNTNSLLTTIYEYVQEDASTYIRNQPIQQEWATTFQAMTTVQDFLLLEILDPDNGLASDPMLQEMVTGSLCDAIPTTNVDLARLCKTMGGGVVEKGIVGLNSYTLAAVKEVKEEYDYSAKTWDDKVTALSFEGLTNIEVFYPFTYKAYIWIDQLIRKEISDDLDHFNTYVLGIVLSYLVVYIIVGGLMCHKITTTLTQEICHWRRMLKLIPQTVILDNKLLKSYIARTSNGLLRVK